ncbi:MAG: ATP-binding cassette domain-containing protein [Sediminibacterium sp.]|nr:ATP-binding cassette domain-containing protein [Sediminibacterium sp.]
MQNIPSATTQLAISLEGAGKKYNREWIFRNLHFSFEWGKSYAVTGPNGSGKSTLLQCIAGAIHLSEGGMQYQIFASGKSTPIPENSTYQFVSIAAPYLELVEEMTANELLNFHAHFKPFTPGVTITEILSAVVLEKSANKQIRYFSSGMKQRLKLAQAFYSNVPLLLLDEPCSNLDRSGIELYKDLCAGPGKNKLIIVGSNDPQETDFCTQRIHLPDYQKG